MTMYGRFTLAKKYLRYFLQSSNGKGHGMHSPFVFDFILRVLNNGANYQPPASIEALRKKLRNDPTSITVEELGAGSRSGIAKQKRVADIARTALKPPQLAQV